MWDSFARIRGPGIVDFDPFDAYDDDNLFTIRVFHGGKFTNAHTRKYVGGKSPTKPHTRKYVGGKVNYIDFISTQDFGLHYLVELIKELGYPCDQVFYFYFKLPNLDLDTGLRALANTASVERFCSLASRLQLIEIYVEHQFTTINTFHIEHEERQQQALNQGTGIGSVSQQASYVTGIGPVSQESKFGVDAEHDAKFVFDEQKVVYEEVVDEKVVDLKVDDEKVVDEKVVDEKVDDDSDYIVDEDEEVNSHSDNGDDSDYIVDEDNVIDDPEVDMEHFRAAVDNDIDSDIDLHNAEKDEDDVHIDLDDFESNSENEEFEVPLNRTLKRMRQANKGLGHSTCPFKVGKLFEDKEEIKLIVKEHGLDTRRQLYFIKNDSVRLRVVCLGNYGVQPVGDEANNYNKVVNSGPKKLNKDGQKGESSASGQTPKKKQPTPRKKNPKPTCPWALQVSRPDEHSLWCVKTFKNEHKCLQTRVVNLYTMSWIAREIAPLLELNPTIPLAALQDQLQKKHQIQISLMKIGRAKNIARNKVHGDYINQYVMLRDYLEELLRANPGSTVKLDVEPDPNPTSLTKQFRIVYICFAALKIGFKMAGRNILGLDGCFMKGPYPGQILTAVGVDANNGIYPLAYAVVEAETKKSWEWFLELLRDDLEFQRHSSFTFISDRQKGLIPALENTFPNAEHRFCLRHIHENMKSKWRGNLLKNMLWKCAAATTIPQFEKRMDEVKKEDASLYEWLKQIPPEHWCRAYFSGLTKSDVVLNNLCEVFNKQLVGGRDKAIITCLEYIREYMTKRIMVVHRVIAKSEGFLTPTATKNLNAIKEETTKYNVLMASPVKYEVSYNGITEPEKRVVNIEAKTCSCRRWELTSMPCRHAVAVLWDMAQHGYEVGNPETWVDEVYWLSTWKKVYMNTLEPINGKDLWIPSACPIKLLAPKHHKQIGRPKKQRKKSAIEIEEAVIGGKLTRKGGTTTCGKCGKQGHNKRGCTGQVQSSQQASQSAPQPTQD